MYFAIPSQLKFFNPLFIEYAEKICGENGQWEGRRGSAMAKDSSTGWTNYTPCFTSEMLSLIQKLYTGSEDEAKVI